VWRLTLCLLVALLALGADGDSRSNYASGQWLVHEYMLCDGDHTLTNCNEIDLHVETAAGLPQHAVVDINRLTGCSGTPVVQVRGLNTPLGFPIALQDLTLAGVSSVVVDPNGYRYLDAMLTDAVGCSDLEVIVRLFYPRTP